MVGRQIALSREGGRKMWFSVGVVALIAVLAGTVLPQMLSSPTAASSASITAAKADTGVLTYTAPALPDEASPKALLLRLFLGTGAVLGICVAALWLGRRWLVGAAPADNTQRQMRLVETLSLGNRCSVHLIKVGERPVLVGVDGFGVKTMVALPEAFADTLTNLTASEGAPNPPAIAAWSPFHPTNRANEGGLA